MCAGDNSPKVSVMVITPVFNAGVYFAAPLNLLQWTPRIEFERFSDKNLILSDFLSKTPVGVIFEPIIEFELLSDKKSMIWVTFWSNIELYCLSV